MEMKKGGEERWSYVQPPYGDAQDEGADPGRQRQVARQRRCGHVRHLQSEGRKRQGFRRGRREDLGKYHLDPAKDDILRIEIERVEEIAKDAKGNKEKKTAKVALLVGVGKKVG